MKSNYFPESFFRVVTKALYVRNGKILLTKEAPELSNQWELPGGGLDHGENPKDGLIREIREELGLEVTSVSEYPVYVWTNRFEGCRGMDWYYSVVLAYKIDLKNLDFTPTEECTEIRLFSIDELKNLGDLYHQSHKLREIFKASDFEGV
jgi:8-oxo-dGTP diphosphatase